MLLVFLSIAFISGCAGLNTKAPRVYWGDYSDTLYELKKEPSPETIANHKFELEEIISKSKAWHILPPPGICAELGKLYLENGDTSHARELMNQEALHYPESKVLIAMLLNNIESRNKDRSPE